MTATLQLTATQIAAKVESTAGTWETALDTDSTTTASADFIFSNPAVEFLPEFTPRDVMTASHARMTHFAPARHNASNSSLVQVKFDVELAGHEDNDGTGNVAEAPVARLLTACGCFGAAVRRYPVTTWSDADTDVLFNAEVVNGDGGGSFAALNFGSSATDVNESLFLLTSTMTGTATPAETITGAENSASVVVGTLNTLDDWGLVPHADESLSNTLSILVLQDGREFRVRGARGNAVIRFPHAGLPYVQFQFIGALEATGDRTPLAGADIPLALHDPAPTCWGLGFDMDSSPGGADPFAEVSFSEISLDMGNNVVMHASANSANAYDYARIQSRTPTLSIDMDERTEQNHEDAFEEAHEWHQVLTVGSTVGNIWECRIPAAYMRERVEIERGDLRGFRYTFSLAGGHSNEDDLTTGSYISRPFAENGEFALYNR